jgi:tetratricopeptide (TPR) repeat protein
MLLDSLIELHAGECSEHALAEARGLSAVGFGMMTFGARRLARRYHHRAQAVAERSANLSAIAFAGMALAFVDFYDGRWDEFDARMTKAATMYRESGDLHRWGSPAMMVQWVQVARGGLDQARAHMSELVQVGKDAADPQISSWGGQVLGRALLALGPLAEAEAVLREGATVARAIHSLDNLLHLQAMLVSCLVLQGRLDECPPLLDEAHAIIRREKMNRDFDKVEVLVADAGYRLARVESLQGEARAAALREAQRACGAALACTRRMPLWLPAGLRLQATGDWLGGNEAAARKGWQESLQAAEQSAFPVERGLTLMEMGRRGGDAALVREAAELFRQTGAMTYLAMAEPGLYQGAASAAPEPARRAA